MHTENCTRITQKGTVHIFPGSQGMVTAYRCPSLWTSKGSLRDITHSTKSLACVTSLLLIQQLDCLSIVWQNNPYHFRSSIMSNSVFNSSPCLVAPLPPPSRNNQSFCGRGLGNNLRSAQLRAIVLSAQGITACAISSRDVNEPPTASHIFLLYSSI